MKSKISSNRSFGVLFSIVFLLIAFWPFFNSHNFNDIKIWSLILSSILLILAIIKSKILTPFNIAWIKFGNLLGRIIAPIVLATLYFFVLTPIGLLLKLFKKDILNLRIKKDVKTYWLTRDFKILFKKQF